MYFAQNTEFEKFKLYYSFFSGKLNDKINSEKYTDFLNKIIIETHRLSSGSINYSDVSKEIFDIVSLLNLNHKEYFMNISTDIIGNEIYESVSNFIKKDIEIE